MNYEYQPEARRVIPNWRYYESTLDAGELDNWMLTHSNEKSYNIENYIQLWKEHQSIYRAGDLLSAAITNGVKNNEFVNNAACFILERQDVSTHSMLLSAKKVLGITSGNSQSEIEIERLRECTDIKDIRKYIHTLRQRLHLIPHNPFLYVDLSRAYLLLGQNRKAENSILQALHFGASNRFVARSAARFYLHKKDMDRAYEVIRANGAVSIDPWLMASEISINMLRNKTSNYIKKGREIIDSGQCHPFGYTELATAIATLEYESGSNRLSNKLFRKALRDPNDNSLAQIQWINSSESLSLDISASVRNDYEVKTIDAINQCDYERARHEAVSWICDMPFAHKPINIGYSICVNALQDYALASAILDVGLRLDETNPFLLNNKAYCLARTGQILEAKKTFDRLINSNRINESRDLKVCIPATQGLIYYRNKEYTAGAEKYTEAINIAAQQMLQSGDGSKLYKKAILNYCREKIVARDGDIHQALDEARKMFAQEENDTELKLLFEEVTNEYNNQLKNE